MEPQRKAPRWLRTLRFAADDGFGGQVLDVSAVGFRLGLSAGQPSPPPSDRLWPGTLTLESGAHVRLKVRVARVTSVGAQVELGLEVAEADKAFYDALPRLRADTGEFPNPDG